MANTIETLSRHLALPPTAAARSPTEPASRSASGIAARRSRRRLGPGRPVPYGRLLGPAVVLLLWALTSAVGLLDPRVIPAPWTVLHTGLRLWRTGSLPTDVLTSASRAAAGFGIGLSAGLALALVAGLSRAGEALIDGTVQVKRAIPNLGLIPLFILWLGIGEPFKIAIIALGVFIPIYLNTHAALSGIDTRYVELAEVVRLSRWQFIRQIVIPGALPGVFVGLRLAVVGSWLSLVVLEQINATSGLGYLMSKAQNYGQTDVIVVGLLIYGGFGFVSDALVRLTQRRMLAWQRTLTS
ncbi:MAG: sulfonate transport system permease protein [Chloroflexota bacterium]|jgi:sulfonate transport system permease protein|nr:sulfonate transport system permease protein [Chloroflexota bacterium]